MIRNCDAGHACIDGVPFVCPWCKLDAANADRARLREALEPFTQGLYWITPEQLAKARAALAAPAP